MRFGRSYPTSTNDVDRAFGRGYLFGLHVFKARWDWFALGLEGDAFLVPDQVILRTVTQEDAANRIIATSTTRLRSLSALATARINLVFDRPWTVYVKGGAGYHKSTGAAFLRVVNERTGGEANERLDVRGRGLAKLAAGGLEAFAAKNLSVAFEARFVDYGTPRGGDDFEYLHYQLALSYWFGRRK